MTLETCHFNSMGDLQEPFEKLEVPIPYIFLAYFSGLNFRGYPIDELLNSMSLSVK